MQQVRKEREFTLRVIAEGDGSVPFDQELKSLIALRLGLDGAGRIEFDIPWAMQHVSVELVYFDQQRSNNDE